jgi:hypothetical protein
VTWTNLLSYSRLRIPEAQSAVISDANMLILTNQICKEFVDLTECLPTYTRFNATAEQQEYSIATNVSTYLRIRDEGLWWYYSTGSTWKRLKAYTLDRLIQEEETWINRSSGSPLKYWIEGDTIGIHPKPDTSDTTYGFRLYHFAQSTNMSLDTHYPFSGSTTQYSHLAHHDETIVDGVRYKVKQILGKHQQAEEAKSLFFAKCEKIRGELKDRKDLLKDGSMRGVGYAIEGGMF